MLSQLTDPEFLAHKERIERQVFSIWMPHKGQVHILTHFLINWQTGLFLKAGRKFGKALCLETPILTDNGFKRNGDIVAGDIIFDEKGNKQKVLIAHDIIENAEAYRIHFCNGTYLDACKDHQWFTWTKCDRKNYRRGLKSFYPSVKSTLEIFNTQMHGKEFNHSIPYADPFISEDKKLPNKKSLHHTIVKVEKIKNKPMRCLTVSGESSLYLAGKSLIPTHNSEPSIVLLYIFAKLFDNAECYYIADEKDHAGDIVWDNGRLPGFFSRGMKQLRGESFAAYQSRKKIGLSIEKEWDIQPNNSEMMVKMKNGSFIKVEGAKNFSIANGLSPTIAVYDEFKDHDPRFDETMRPNLNAMKGRIFIMGTPPPAEDGDENTSEHHYFKTMREFKTRKGYGYIHRYCYDNPHVYPGGVRDQVLIEEEQAYRKKGEYHVFAREYLGLLVPDQTKSIFPMLDQSIHRKSYIEMLQVIQSNYKKWDFYTSYDPASASTFAVLIVAIHRFNKTIFLMDEIYEKDQQKTLAKSIYKRAKKLREDIYGYLEDWHQVYDHAEAWFANEVANEFGDGISPCTKDMKNKEARLSVIKDAMVYGRFYISDRCPHAYTEMRSYAKDKNGHIPKANDHQIDNLRYVLNANGYSSVERIPIAWDDLTGRRFSTPELDRRHNMFEDESLEHFFGGNDGYVDD